MFIIFYIKSTHTHLRGRTRIEHTHTHPRGRTRIERAHTHPRGRTRIEHEFFGGTKAGNTITCRTPLSDTIGTTETDDLQLIV